MEKKEFVLSFIDVVKNGEEAKVYKYLTSRTKIYFVKEAKEITLDKFVEFVKENLLNEEIEVLRVFESNVCTKVEIKSKKFAYDAFLFEVKERRFSRIEVM